MKTAKHIGILFLLFVFLFSTMGISILHHVCNSSQHNDITVYPEIFKAPGSPCCGTTVEVTCCDDDPESEGDNASQVISAMPCCVSISSYLKLEIPTLRSEKLVISNFTAFLSHDALPSRDVTTEKSLSSPDNLFQFYSPPITGKRLIHFLHQSKIPDHPSHAITSAV